MQNIYQSERLNDNYIVISIRTWLLAVYLFFAPFDFLQVIPGVSLSRVLICLPLVGCFLYMKYMKIRLDRFLFVIILYVGMLIISMFYTYDLESTSQRIITVGLNMAVILTLSMFHYNKSEITIIKKAMVLSGWLTLFLMLFYSNTSLMGGRITVSVNGVYQDPNYLCGFFIFPIIHYFGEFIKKKYIFSFIKMSVFIILVLLTGSRGGLLAILGSLIFYCLIWMITKKFTLSSIVLIISVTSIFIIFFNTVLGFLPQTITQRFDASFTVQDGAAGRGAIWESIIYKFNDSPNFNMLFGWGAGTIRNFTYNGSVGHNIWIESLVEVGVIGVLVLFIFYFTFFKKALKMDEYVVSASFIGYMIMAMSMSLYSYKPIWNIILLIMILKNSTVKREIVK
ncbi:O-antigen ligase family protein [Solibacillus sp. FSL H8-0538]|uniref:O-antigen ligase family protein n=1 Tax=Solibacillus sp. FSL H8-0538 TaxID=2921400 RepID=UPI0030FA76CE